ncbi:MAG: thymidine phosphorylase [Gemmatimonadales bacterium]
MLNVPRLIERKRDGGSLAPSEWDALVTGYVAGEVPDYQMSALAMAIVFRGLEPAELTALTRAMLGSGDRFALADLPVPRVDKHSIGGVGDKTSLLLAPLLASLGVAVPMISGRGLGHTGGTLDKLESIPGFRTDLSLDAARRQLESLGVVMIGQTRELVPADRKLYALRDVTGTVESIPLIAASIMSKKLAEDLTGLVLDLKTGSGAFLTEPARTIELGETMIGLGEANGCRTVGLVTAMDRPLGVACGNALEVAEAIAGLEGSGPSELMALTYALAVEMLLVSGRMTDPDGARAAAKAAVHTGRARETFGRLIEAQGGDPRVLDRPGLLPRAKVVQPVTAGSAGIVSRVEPRAIGHAIVELGGGRRAASDRVDPSVGVRVLVAPGTEVDRGAPLAEVHARDAESAAIAVSAVRRAIELGGLPAPLPLISHRISRSGIQPYQQPPSLA